LTDDEAVACTGRDKRGRVMRKDPGQAPCISDSN
jgi:hypothetical protein